MPYFMYLFYFPLSGEAFILLLGKPNYKLKQAFNKLTVQPKNPITRI